VPAMHWAPAWQVLVSVQVWLSGKGAVHVPRVGTPSASAEVPVHVAKPPGAHRVGP